MKKFILSGLAMFLLSFSANVQAQNPQVEKTFGKVYAVKNGEVRIPVVMHNVNAEDVHNLTLTVDVDGKKQQINVVPEYVTENNGSAKFYVTINSPSLTGLSDVNVTVDAINGNRYEQAANTTTGNLMTLTRKVPHKVVIEDFTAVWCPACPSGIVGVQKTKQIYGDKVLIIAAHDRDPMECRDYKDFVEYISCIPRALVDRDPNIGEVNPYLGSERGDNGAKYGLWYDIDEQMAIDPVADMKVDAVLDGKKITAKSDVTFLYTGEADYGIAYVLLKDSLHNKRWKQKNSLIYYKGNDIVEKEPLFDMWINGEGEIPDYMYNDVAVAAKDVEYGMDNSIPANVTEEETISHEYTFDLNNYVKVSNTENISVCALLIDRTTHKIINSASVKLDEASSIEGIYADGENVTETARYTVDGRMITAPEKGINIVKYSDGSVKKIVVR